MWRLCRPLRGTASQLREVEPGPVWRNQIAFPKHPPSRPTTVNPERIASLSPGLRGTSNPGLNAGIPLGFNSPSTDVHSQYLRLDTNGHRTTRSLQSI